MFDGVFCLRFLQLGHSWFFCVNGGFLGIGGGWGNLFVWGFFYFVFGVR